MRLTEYLAIYGALLSTIVAMWSIVRSLPKIRVLLIYASEEPEGEIQHGIGISIQNPSTCVAHITNVSFLYRYKNSNFIEQIKHYIEYKRISRCVGWCHSSLSDYGIKDGCPVSIEPGKAHWIFIPGEALEELFEDATSRELRVVVQDELWRNKYSKILEYK